MKTLRLIYRKVKGSIFLKNKYLNILLKSLIVIGFSYVLYNKITREEDLDVMVRHIYEFLNFPNLLYLIATGLLIPFMWWAESFRWLILVRRIVNPSRATLRKSFKAMISGHAIGIFVHNRIGKIGGRIIAYESSKKAELLIVNYFDAEAIKLLLDIYGFFGAMYVLHVFLEWQLLTVVILGILIAAIIIFRIYLFYNIKTAIDFFSRFKIRETIIKRVRLLEEYSVKELRQIMQVTGFRVLMNFLQYYLLMRFFHIEVPLFEALILISAIYFIVSNFPLPSIAGMLARIQLAIFIWSHYTDNIISVSCIPLILWFFNSLIPTLIGTYILVNTNLAKNINS